MVSFRFHFCFLVLFVVFLTPTHSHGHICLPKQHVALFIFGDSIFDAGNNDYINTTTDNLANYGPYGETFFNYPTGRFSNGRLIPDFIAEFAKLPFITPLLYPGYHQYTDGSNFASGGAGALVETNKGLVIDLKSQLHYFEKLANQLRKNLGHEEAKKLLARAVYLISIGSNDYFALFTSNSSALQTYSPEEYVDIVIGNLTSVIKGIYKKGGRKVAMPNLGPLGCSPITRALNTNNTGACIEGLSALAKLHNEALSKSLQELENQLDGFKYSITDKYNSLSETINNPSKYGFKESKIACCGTGPYKGTFSCGGKRSVKEYELCENVSEYVFFDSIHATEKANKQIAELMWSGTPNITGPYNLAALFEN
ncbi:GDSL esterase/lipase 1-like [Quercus suber]|uniref:Gdsl esterase/lipase 1 n=1 Tax=Quercus suber TaxID=58331 RepID=A0AAW0KT78_QUESU|nr:GDSL esterase/lipase 1-like [Quercus suber]